jgi:hypothetical protein
VLRAKAALGRVFTAADARPDALCTALISDSLWHTTFGGDSDAVGRTLLLNGERCTLVGVMPPGFDFPSRTTQFWKPLWFVPDDYEDRSNRFLRVVARLKPGASMDEARSELQVMRRWSGGTETTAHRGDRAAARRRGELAHANADLG